MNEEEKLDTSFVGHHISSGGFIFYKDIATSEIFTLMITNQENVIWICKGHLEKNEDQISAAFREFKEEMGLEKSNLEYVGLVKKISYSYEENGGNNTKDVYINVFSANEKIDLSKNIGVEDITKIEWYLFEDALNEIYFNKEELSEAKDMFINYLKTYE